MYLTIHTPLSLILGKKIKKPILVFILAFLVHLILDSIPHEIISKHNYYFYIIMICDLILLSSLLYILYKQNKIKFNLITITAILGGIMPDALWFLNDLTFNKIFFLNSYSQLNIFIHKIFYPPVFIPWYLSIIIQLFTFAITLLIFYKISKKQKHS